MNGMSNRDRAFLAEMGIAPLWSARAKVQAAAPEAHHEPAADAEAVSRAAPYQAMPSPAPAPGSMIDSAWGEAAALAPAPSLVA